MGYRLYNYPDEVRFIAEGDILEDMFLSASDALNEVMRGDIKILEQTKKVFIINGNTPKELLYEFLNVFLMSLNNENFLISKITRIKILNGEIECTVVGDNAENYKFTNDVKAIDYSKISFRDENNKFSCQVVLNVC